MGVRLIVDRPLDSLLRNVRGCDIVLGAAARHGKPLLFTSTSEVYGKNGSDALSEESDRLLGSPFKARWSYATAKSFGEALVHGYSRECGAPMLAARLFNVVGPRQSAAYGMVLPRLVRQALAGDDQAVFGNGMQTRCFHARARRGAVASTPLRTSLSTTHRAIATRDPDVSPDRRSSPAAALERETQSPAALRLSSWAGNTEFTGTLHLCLRDVGIAVTLGCYPGSRRAKPASFWLETR